ncbi:MAG: hypothetical protein JWM53_3951 [bacterium]|nr:hypothetical protein [bacterium]
MSPAGDEAFDEDRVLCSDGGCLGIVVDGKCNVCGLASVTSPRDPGSGHPGNTATSGGGDMVSEGGHVDEAFDDDERQLCPDGACTGLLGPDSKCKVCGRTP